MIHIDMDGPSTNWLVYSNVKAIRSDEELPVLANIGSCGLHVVSGALGVGLSKSSWPLKKVLKSLFNLFHDSPCEKRFIYPYQ